MKRTQLGVCMIVVGTCLLAVQIISLTSFIQGGCPLWILTLFTESSITTLSDWHPAAFLQLTPDFTARSTA